LIETAKAAFAEVGLTVSLEEIARRAGVGIGTLYRHFPTREAVVEAVYRREVEQLAEAVPHLLQNWGPGEALHKWMHLFIDYIATKRLIAPSLGTKSGRSSALYATSADLINGAIATLVKRAIAKRRSAQGCRPVRSAARHGRRELPESGCRLGSQRPASHRLVDGWPEIYRQSYLVATEAHKALQGAACSDFCKVCRSRYCS
jgi:AcrR family transcriptional regulator